MSYRFTSSLGTNGGSLIVFVESEDRGEDDENDNEEESTGDELIKLIKSEGKGNFMLRGSCTVLMHFETPTAMQEAYQKISELVGEDDLGNSQCADDELMEEMISADDIDENGNIINREERHSD